MSTAKKHTKNKQPWPTKQAMAQVYDLNLWGGESTEFYSGEGSHHPEIVKPYIKAVTSFLTSFEPALSVCDLGCGDFNIGKKLVKHTNKYIAVDIVDDLITYNKEKFKADNLEFLCLDIAEDALPSANCVIIRQVLQHLSNKEILRVLQKLITYKYIILTEHIPNGEFLSNKDIISGQGIRLKKNSGLNILETPFNFQVKEIKELQSFCLEGHKGVIKTIVYYL